MADTTTRYDFPFQEATDPPDGASLGQELAEAVDTSLGTVEDALDARLDALEAATLDARLDALEGRPHVMVNLSKTFTNNTIEQITIGTKQWNNAGIWVSGDQLVVPTGTQGLWEIGIVGRFASQASAAGQRNVRIYKNGSEEMSFTIPAVSNLNSTNIICAGTYEAVVADGDIITFWGFQNSGGSLALTGNSRAWMRQLVR